MEPITKQELKEVLSEQAKVILDAVDEKFNAVDERFDAVDERFDAVDEKFKKIDERLDFVDYRFNVLEKKLEEMEARFNQKLDALMTVLDNFLKRLTDFEDEFAIMKAEVDKIKEVIKEKLGVEVRI